MIDYREAIDIITSSAVVRKTEKVSLKNCLNRVLAKDVVSDVDMPPFDKSAVDGYACKHSELLSPLHLKAVIRAGEEHNYHVGVGECYKIMTGAMLPENTDCVFMVEYSSCNDDGTVKFTGDKTRDNIARQGEDVRKGDMVISKGSLLDTKFISVLSAVGCTNIEVYCTIKVGIVTTGDEIVEPDVIPSGVQIRNCNGPQLEAQLRKINATSQYYGIVTDNFERTLKILKKAIAENDVLMITGGVSMGDFDYVKDALHKLGAELFIEKIAIKPGKPTVFGKINEKFVFGLPGNPVSSFVIFEIFVKPFLLKCMGSKTAITLLRLPFAAEFTTKKSDRTSFIPVKININGELEQIDYHGSAHVHSLIEAHGIATIENETECIKKGELVDVRLF